MKKEPLNYKSYSVILLFKQTFVLDERLNECLLMDFTECLGRPIIST